MVIDTLAEERAGEAAQAGQDRFLPATESSRPVRDLPEGYGLAAGSDLPKKYITVDEAEVGEAGGSAAYMEIHHPADLVECNAENITELEWMWERIYGEPCPYDFSDEHDRDINYQIALDDLERGWGIEVGSEEGEGQQIDVKFDWHGLSSELTRSFLKRKGDEQFVQKIWGDCTSISLCEPVKGEGPDWKIIVESSVKGKRDFMMISQPDFENSMVTENARPIRLPKLGVGDRNARVKFIEALHNVRIGGISMPPVVNVEVRMGATFPKKKERKS